MSSLRQWRECTSLVLHGHQIYNSERAKNFPYNCLRLGGGGGGGGVIALYLTEDEEVVSIKFVVVFL